MSRDSLTYDFFQPRLWLTRFLSVEDAIDKTDRLFHMVWNEVGGFANQEFIDMVVGYIHRRMQSADQVERAEWNELLELLAKTETHGEVYESLNDRSRRNYDYEAGQLLNLFTLSYSIKHFMRRELYPIVEEMMHRAEEEGSFPPTHQIRKAFRNISHDNEIVQRAIVQRLSEQPTDGRYPASPEARGLLTTDKIARIALHPCQRLLTPKNRTIVPITFFSEYTHIRRMPHSDDVLLIGIGYDHVVLRETLNAAHDTYQIINEKGYLDDALPAFELMAIPHEVGHYVYYHADLNGQGQTFAQLAKEQFSDHAYFDWCEEIFADIYSCMVAGPLAALGLQALLSSTDEHRICSNDGAHPTPSLRPFLLSRILQTVHPEHGEADAEQLGYNWNIILASRNPLIEDQNEIIESVMDIVGTFTVELRRVLSEVGELRHLPWTGGAGELREYDEHMEGLIEAFNNANINTDLISLWHDPERSLPQILTEWGESGPLTIGSHSYTDEEINFLSDPRSRSTDRYNALVKLSGLNSNQFQRELSSNK